MAVSTKVVMLIDAAALDVVAFARPTVATEPVTAQEEARWVRRVSPLPRVFRIKSVNAGQKTWRGTGPA